MMLHLQDSGFQAQLCVNSWALILNSPYVGTTLPNASLMLFVFCRHALSLSGKKAASEIWTFCPSSHQCPLKHSTRDFIRKRAQERCSDQPRSGFSKQLVKNEDG